VKDVQVRFALFTNILVGRHIIIVTYYLSKQPAIKYPKIWDLNQMIV
jgi:hypothetical protein